MIIVVQVKFEHSISESPLCVKPVLVYKSVIPMLRSARLGDVVGKGKCFSFSRVVGARRFRSNIIIDNDDVLVVSKPVGPFQMVSKWKCTMYIY